MEMLMSINVSWEDKFLFLLADVMDIGNITPFSYVKSTAASQSCNKSAVSDVQESAAGKSCLSVDSVNLTALEIGQSDVSGVGDAECDVFVSNERNVSFVEEAVVDWSQIEIAPTNGEDIDVPITEENMCLALGIHDVVQVQPAPSSIAAEACMATIDEGLLAEAAIPVNDDNPEEQHFIWDRDWPHIKVVSLLLSMVDFRKAIRQFFIRKEFDIKVDKADTTRYMGHCKEPRCPWKITTRLRTDKRSIRVNKLVPIHDCSSTSRVKLSMSSQAWVVERSVSILQKEPTIGAKSLQKKLQETYTYTVGCDTAWKGKDRTLDQLYGTWTRAFNIYGTSKSEVEKRSPGSIVEIDVKKVGGKVYFSKFFMALQPCTEGFLTGCRPYLSIESTALNGKWNSHLAACTSLDGHNWMFPLAFAFFDSETDANWTWFLTQLSRH